MQLITQHKKCINIISALALSIVAMDAFSINLKESLLQGHPVLQLGGFWSHQGTEQHININSLIGDQFTVSRNDDSNGLVGVGYFIDGQDKDLFKMSYGVNAFYLAKTGVAGYVIQENLFTNLSYGYKVTHYPVLAVAKSTINTKSPKYSWTVDAGIGPNFMSTGEFQEHSLDNGVTVPDNIFSGRTVTTFSAMGGIGFKANNFFGPAPLECGYKFFYLGQGYFSKQSNQVLNSLNTGTTYANALMCSITV